MEVEALADPDEPPAVDEQLGDGLGRRPLEPELREGLVQRGGRHAGRPELGLDPVGRRLLRGRQAHGVPGSTDLVLVDDENAGRGEALEQREEDALLQAPEPRAQLFLRHPRLERLAGVEGRQRRLGLPPEALRGLGMDVPLAVDDEDAPARHEVLEERAERLGAERRPGPELRRARSTPADALDVRLEDRRGLARLEGPEASRRGPGSAAPSAGATSRSSPPPIVTMGE